MQADCDSVIRRYLEGDEDAFRALLEPVAPALRARIGRRMAPLLRRRVSVQDVLQEVAIVAFDRRATFAGTTREEFSNWIMAIADRRIQGQVNRHTATQKRALRKEISRPGRADTADVVGRAPSPSQQAIGAEAAELAKQALALLSPDYREVLRLCREEGLSLLEVGVRMGRSHEAARKLHGRALMQFIEQFDRLRGDGRD